MKKYGLIGIAALLVICIGWSGLWFLTKGKVEQRVDLELAQLEAQGWKVTHRARAITGFPFGYVLTLDDAAAINIDSGLLVRLPHLSARVAASALSEIHVDLPDTFSIDVPFSEVARLDNPALPKVLSISGNSIAMSALLKASEQGGYSAELTAQSVAWRVGQPDLAMAMAGDVTDLQAGVTRAFAQDDMKLRLQAKGATLDLDDSGGPDTQPGTVLGYQDISLSATTDFRSLNDLYEAIYGGASGHLDGAYQTGRSTYKAAITTPEADQQGLLVFESAFSTGLFTIAPGRLSLNVETRQNLFELRTPDKASPLNATLAIEASQARYALPTAPSEKPSDMELWIALLEATATEDTWTRLDPSGTLDRSAANLVIDLSGTMRVTKRIDHVRPGEAPPFEVSNVIVNEASLNGLGSAASVEGDIEILQPIALPMGTLNLTLSKPKALLDALSGTGIISAEIARTGDAMLQVFAVPGVSDDEWTSDISFGHQGIMVNGRPVQ